MRKPTALLCAICILCLAASALAAPGDAYVLNYDQRNELGIREYNTPNMTVVGDTVYTLWGADVYAWQTGSDAPEKVASDLLFGYYQTLEAARLEMGDDAEKIIQQITSDNGVIYGLNTLNGTLYPLTFADGKAAYGEPIMLDWSEILARQGDDEYFDLFNPKISDGMLYMLYRTYDEYDNPALLSFDLQTGAQKRWDASYVRDYTPYRDGKLLLEIYNYETAYNQETREMDNPTLAIFDPADGSVTEVGYFGNSNVFGIAYDTDTDTLYYTTNSMLMAMVALGDAVQVAYVPVDYLSDAAACMLPGGLYAVISWEGLIVRNTDPQYMPSSSLSVYGGYTDNASVAFMAQHPEIPILFVNDTYYSTTSALAQAMASGDQACDIYSISLSYQDFAGLMDKGYCMDLSAYPDLTNALSGLYPFIQTAITKDGAFYAVPNNPYGYGLSIFPEAWEAAGIEDRMPESFMGFIDFLQWWVDEGMDEYPDVTLMQDAYDYGDFLFNLALNLYITQYQAEGRELTLDTPLFREMLEAIEALDIDALNDTVPDQDENGESMVYIDNREDCLFTRYGDWLTVYDSSDYSAPLVLSIEDGGARHIPVYLSCLFVNPNTEHPDIAAAYMLNAVEQMENVQHIMMFPDDNEPVHYEHYEEIVADYESLLAEAQASLETAAPEDVKDIQSAIDNYQDFLDHKEDYYWIASEESIAAYRALIPMCYAATPNILSYSSNEEGTSEIRTLIDRYLQKQMTLDQFITQADQKIRMIQLEMQ